MDARRKAITSEKEAVVSAAKDQLSPENARSFVTDIASGDVKGAVDKAESLASNLARAELNAGIRSANASAASSGGAPSQEARARINALVGTPEARRALIARGKHRPKGALCPEPGASQQSGVWFKPCPPDGQ